MRDVTTMAAEVVKSMRDYVARAVSGITSRLDALEQKVESAPPQDEAVQKFAAAVTSRLLS